MSYILEALKKSDQQRQRSATPTLLTSHEPAAVPAKPVLLYYGLLAAVLLSAGISIGWLRPWQADAPEATPVSVKSMEPATVLPDLTPQPVASEKIKVPQPGSPTPVTVPATPSVPEVVALKTATAAPAKTVPAITAPVLEKPAIAPIAEAPQEQKTIPMAELPPNIQQEIPAMTIPLHAYSSKPRDRLVSINGRILRESENLTSDLRLEQITPDGMIFSYKGYRFRRGVQQ